MSTLRLRQLGRYIPLWRRTIPQYPQFWKGNPQLREPLPLFWARIVKPKDEMPPECVMFEVHPQMTKADISQYLEKIYELPIQHVHTFTTPGEFVKEHRGYILNRLPDRRFANVQLKEGHTFEFPDIFTKKDQDIEIKEFEKQKRRHQRQLHKSWSMQDVPSWFR